MRKLPRGLKNLTNTCYFSVVIQCLSSCGAFVSELEKHFKDTINKEEESVAESLCIMIRKLKDRLVSFPCNPKQLFYRICKLTSCKHYANLKQQDARELFENLLTHWREGTKKEKQISDLIWGTMCSVVSCPVCKDHSEEYDPWSVLTLSLDETKQENELSSLLVKHTSEETLDEDTKKCKNCRGTSERRLTRKLTFTNIPEVLVLHLKRFEWSVPQQASMKIKKKVKYAEQLTIAFRPSPEDKEDRLQTYYLKGLVVHIGEHITNGHYEAYAKDTRENNSWYWLNDDCVKRVGIKTVLNQEAYMLFYEKSKNPEVGENALNNLKSYRK